MTEQEAIKMMQYRIDTATEIAGKGEDGNAFEDMEMAIKALKNQNTKNPIKKFFKKLIEIINKEIKVLDANLELAYDTKLKWSEREKWDLETGKKFNDLVCNYPISEDELLEMSKVLCEFVMQTRVTDIEEYFFVNRNRDRVRLPFMLGDAYDIGEIISELKGEMNIDEKGNNVLNGGSEEYEQKWKYEIGENYGLNKAIKIIKKHCYK